MRIAFLVTKFPALSETFILNQITGLIDRGHEVDIFASKGETHGKMHGNIVKYNLLEHTYYMHIPKNKLIRLGYGAVHLMERFPRRMLPLVKSLNVLRFRKKALTLSMFYAALPFIDKDPYDIIHCHFGPNGNLGIQLRDLGALKGKIVVTFHGHDMTSYILKYGQDVYDYLFRKGDLFLPVSERWKNKLISLGCREEKLSVHHMGIDIERYTCDRSRKRDNGKVNILSVARLVEKKGIQYGIKAVGSVIEKHPDIEYRIIGDGPLKDELELLIAGLNLGEKVKLLGWKNQEEILECMNDSDILMAPSVTGKDGDQEGIPVVLMEAMAMGLPVLSTCHSGIPELVQDEVTGFLVPERDVKALTERLANLLEHPEQRLELGMAGRRRVEKDYSIAHLNDQLISSYEQLLNACAGASLREILPSA
jgi:colanic acid/amylovoran biosynthesis glycosyltransferase